MSSRDTVIRPRMMQEYARVKLCSDGKYRWTYPMNMYRNPGIYLTVCKIFGILGLIAFVATNIGQVVHGEFDVIAGELKYWGIAVLVFLAISGLAYLVVAAMYGGKYIVSFTMDEKGIMHEQIPVQKTKARQLGDIVSGAGAAGGNIGRIGQGIMIANHTSLWSDFSRVRRVKAYRLWHTIKLKEPFAMNQVYTIPEDFEFVLGFIKEHCERIK